MVRKGREGKKEGGKEGEVGEENYTGPQYSPRINASDDQHTANNNTSVMYKLHVMLTA